MIYLLQRKTQLFTFSWISFLCCCNLDCLWMRTMFIRSVSMSALSIASVHVTSKLELHWGEYKLRSCDV